jgi:putative ABC transport system ATP-binding protein
VTSLEKEGVKAGAVVTPDEKAKAKYEPMALIELVGIERVFQLGDSDGARLRRLEFAIDAGEYVAVMGPSGSGKSTLLNLLGLLDRPNAGTYRLEGRDVTTLSPDEQARVRSERIGFVFQSFHLVPRLTAAENIALPMTLAGIPAKERNARVAQALKDYGLDNRADHRPTNSPAASASASPSPAPPSCSRR